MAVFFLMIGLEIKREFRIGALSSKEAMLQPVFAAIGGMIALLYVMARDREIPEPFTELNRFGVPYLPLIAATILPVIVLDITESVSALANLYAIGVVGAIVLDLGSTSFGKGLPLKPYHRYIMRGTTVVLLLIWITIACTKLYALIFVGVVLVAGLLLREYTQRQLRKKPAATATAGTSPRAV